MQEGFTIMTNILNTVIAVFGSPLIGISVSAALVKKNLLILWTTIKKYSWMAFLIFFKKLVSYTSYRSLNTLEHWLSDYLDKHYPEKRDYYKPAKAVSSSSDKTTTISVPEYLLPSTDVSNESDTSEVVNVPTISSPSSLLPFLPDTNDTTEEYYSDFKYMSIHRVELFTQDLKAFFAKYKIKAEFAHFLFCINPPKGSREAQRAESLWRKNKNALPEFAHLFASYPEIGEHALSNVITKDKKYIAEWFSTKLFTFSDKGKIAYQE
jgi:hypothetical protein